MIAIVILGLGLVMVATMFPVAWDRARTLSEYTVEQSAAAGAQATLQALLRPAGHSLVQYSVNPPLEELRLTAGSLAGDMFFDPTLPARAPAPEQHKGVLIFSDTSVHALNMENILLTTRQPVTENPWDLEDPADINIVQNRFPYPAARNYPDQNYPRNRGEGFPSHLFYGGDSFDQPQVRMGQRLYPPMEAPPVVGEPDFDKKLDQWNEKLDTRRFCWAVLHRLRSRVGPSPADPFFDQVRKAAAAMGSTRSFDMYYVTLRRPRPTNRYARQDPAVGIPNPYDLTTNIIPVSPEAMNSDADFVFPAAWRVQMEFPAPPALPYAADATGIPTEITVPPAGITGETARMLVQFFPPGTQFIDEITGDIYQVVKRRIVDDKGEKSVLTLDREVVVENLDLPAGDPRCEDVVCVPGIPVLQELLRTVWVFPPAVDRSQSGSEQTPLFDGPSPIVNIEVGTLSISPS